MAPHPELDAFSPMALRKTLVKRTGDAYKQLASAGARKPQDLSGPGFQVLFALIGIGMTMMALWFFFWAKNGGFKWRQDDWEDYKSTVLRRKGPDGKTLSNATKSTRLGGGSVVHGGSFGAPSSIGYTDETGTSADINEYRDAEEGKGGLRGGDGRQKKDKKSRRDNTNDYNDPELRNYRHEKAARVGGLNRQADGHYTDYSGSQPSELGSNVSSAPLVKKSEKKDPKKEAKEKKARAIERMKKAKAAEKEAARTAAAETKARKEEQKAAIRREKEAYKKNKKAKSEATPSEAPEMAEVTRPLTEYTSPQSDYTRAYTEYTAPSVVDTPTKPPKESRRAPPSAAYSFITGDDNDTSTVYTGIDPMDFAQPQPKAKAKPARTTRTAPTVSSVNDVESSYYSDYRPNADPSVYAAATKDRTSRSSSRPGSGAINTSSSTRPAKDAAPRERPQGSRSRPQSKSPEKRHRPAPSGARPNRSQYAPPPSDIFTATNGESQGHMSYPCHIPGLSTAGSVAVSDSVSQAGNKARGGRDVMAGYRRGGGRRDSLSDSE
jgi:hypothetical protein